MFSYFFKNPYFYCIALNTCYPFRFCDILSTFKEPIKFNILVTGIVLGMQESVCPTVDYKNNFICHISDMLILLSHIGSHAS